MTEPGLAPQRTRLAWWRTLLALSVVALLSLRLAVDYGTDAGSMLGAAAAMLLWLGALAVSYHRGRTLTAPWSAATGRVLPLCAAICAGYAVVGTILVLTHLPG
jgi:uncharacterized membrane protein YidH (DUF202 family)